MTTAPFLDPSLGAVDVMMVLAVVLAGVAIHWTIARVEHRLPHWLGDRATSMRRASPAGVARLSIPFLALKVGLWAALIWCAGELTPALHSTRDAASDLVQRSLTTPLFSIGDRGYSALHLLLLPALLAAFWVGVSGIVAVLTSKLGLLGGVSTGVRGSIAMLLRLVLTFLGAIVISQAWGLDLRSVTFVASVLGVGIGFGLQNLANNFVSGIVIGLERPIQPGDYVTLGDLAGTVKRIGARATQIETAGRATILVPNATLLESQVINWSFGDPVARVQIPVSVAYGTELARARRVLLDAAREYPFILGEPSPEVQVRAFGENALELMLLVWTREPWRQRRIRSDLYFRIDPALRRHGIQVPFPQRDLRLGDPEIAVALRTWVRRQSTPEELERAMALARQAPTEPSAEAEEHEADAPWTWGESEITKLAERMRAPGGLEMLDRRHLLTTYRHCFVGREAVDWLVAEAGLSRPDATDFCQLLVDRGIVRHVLDEHGFLDGHFFYRFAAEEIS